MQIQLNAIAILRGWSEIIAIFCEQLMVASALMVEDSINSILIPFATSQQLHQRRYNSFSTYLIEPFIFIPSKLNYSLVYLNTLD